MTTQKKYETIQDALAAFQADMPKVEKKSVNPHFKSKYVSLEDLTAAVLPKLSEFGLSFVVGSFVDNGSMILDAHLLHTSGTSRSAQFPIPDTSNPQKVGSAVSYYRRYALAALTGVVADEDDDGNAASAESPAQRQVNQAKARTAPKPAPKNAPAGVAAIKAKIGELIQQDKATPDEANALVTQKAKEMSKDKNSVEVYEAVLAEIEGR